MKVPCRTLTDHQSSGAVAATQRSMIKGIILFIRQSLQFSSTTHSPALGLVLPVGLGAGHISNGVQIRCDESNAVYLSSLHGTPPG